MKKQTFQIGDRVEAIVDAPEGNGNICIDDLGTVCDIQSEGERIGIAWDNMVIGHTCCGLCDSGHGWYMDKDTIRLHEEEMIEIEERSFMRMISGNRSL